MRLIDGIERNLHRLQEFHIIFLGKRLWSHIQQFGPSLTYILLHLVYRRFVERGVQEVCRSLLLTKMGNEVHLILHQGYQRRDDDGHAVHQQ